MSIFTKPQHNTGDCLRVIYSANSPEIVEKTVRVSLVLSSTNSNHWYSCLYNGRKYTLCQSQLIK